MTKPGRFITFEGGEGAGKSTQVKALAAKLASARDRRHGHARAGRLAGRGRHPQIAGGRRAGPLGRALRNADDLCGARRSCGEDDQAGARARRHRALRPLHGFDLCLSGRGPRHAARNHPPDRIHRAAGPEARSHFHARSAGGRGAQARLGRAVTAKRASNNSTSPSTNACATPSATSPGRTRRAAS